MKRRRVSVCGFFYAIALGLTTGFLGGCQGSDQGNFSAREREVIHAQAPDGRTDYEGKMMKVWTIAELEDSLLLRATALPVSEAMTKTDDYQILRERMLVTVRDSLDEGVGIAAPQVGISRQMIAVQRFDKEGEPFEFFLNPQIIERGDSSALGWEGCLSVPGGLFGKISRAQSLRLRYRTEDFRDTTEWIEGFTAVIFQHEVDHLNGHLFIDHLQPDSEITYQ